MSWSIHLIKLIKNDQFLGDFFGKGDESPSLQASSMKVETTQDMVNEFGKRPYNYIKRMKSDPDVKRAKLLQSRAM